MFSLNPEKIIIILVVALIVFGPERLPEIARQAGKYINEFRKITSNLESEVRNNFVDPYNTKDLGSTNLSQDNQFLSTESYVPQPLDIIGEKSPIAKDQHLQPLEKNSFEGQNLEKKDSDLESTAPLKREMKNSIYLPISPTDPSLN